MDRPIAPSVCSGGHASRLASDLSQHGGRTFLFRVSAAVWRRSLQQAIIPQDYLRRVIGSLKVTAKVAALIGVLIGGVVAETLGSRIALGVGSVIWLIAGAIYLHPTIRSIKTIPTSSPESSESD